MFATYIMASGRNGTLYVGHTDNLVGRVIQHREKAVPGFTATYGCTLLVWYEPHSTREAALLRERQIKRWYRAWKLRIIEAVNPDWRDLLDELTSAGHPLHPDLAFLNTIPPPLVPANAGTQTCSETGGEGEAGQTSLDPRIRGGERR